MRILVTGAAGFIGSHLVERLLSMGHEVYALDDLSTGRFAYVHPYIKHRNYTFVNDTVLNRAVLSQLTKRVDAVFHLAAVLGVKNTVENPLKVIESNVEGTRHVLEAADTHGVKVVLASTSEIYGKNTQLPYREDADRVLGPPTIHRWSYATAKAIDEHLAFAYADRGLPVTVLRYFNSYGPRQTSSDYGGVVARFVKAALTDQPLFVYGDGTQSRCFTYVEDTVTGTVAALKSQANGRVFNIGSTSPVTIRALAHTIRRLANSRSPIVPLSYREAYGAGYEDMPARMPDLSRAQAVLGYTPKVSLQTGLEKTIAWYRSTHNDVNEA